MNIRETILEWTEQFGNGPYVIEEFGTKYTVDVPRNLAEAVLDISILLADRVLESCRKKELCTAEYKELEDKIREKYPDNGDWLFHTVMEAVLDDHLWGRYKDIEAMVGKLKPRGYPFGSAPYLLVMRPEIDALIYAIIRTVDEAESCYDSLVYTFFICILAKGWGEGNGWSKSKEGKWEWHKKEMP